MSRYMSFAKHWYNESILYSTECPKCGEKASYRKEHTTRSGHVRCKKCEKLFHVSE